MILTASDKVKFFPSIQATGAELEGLLWQIESIVESKINRVLDIKTYKQTDTSSDRIIRLWYSPIVSVTSVETRTISRNPYQYSSTFSDRNAWQLLAPESYEVDTYQNQIEILSNSFRYTSSMEIRVIYTSGFDFTDTTNPEVMKIKAIAGQLLTFIAQPSASKGVSSIGVDYQNISYGNTKLEQQMSNQIAALQRYRPYICPVF